MRGAGQGRMFRRAPGGISGPVTITSPYVTLGVILLILEIYQFALRSRGPS